MKLCNACTTAIEGSAEQVADPSGEREYYAHHPSTHAFVAAVQDGCDLCLCLWRTFQAKTGNMYNNLDAFGSPQSQDPGRPTNCTVFRKNDSKPYQKMRLDLELPKENGENVREMALVTFVPSDQISVTGISSNEGGKSRTCASNTGDAKSLEQAAQWLRECDSHPDCRTIHAEDSNWIPARLVDVALSDDSTAVRVVDTAIENNVSSYLTLSHRWGSADFLQLRSTNMGSLMSRIELSDLPQTFRDAIKVCRHLSVRHLWIDSLCIIQDDRRDWSRHAQRMSSIYANARCNIAAEDIKTSQETMFRPLGPLSHTPFHHEVTGTADRAISPGSYNIVNGWLWRDNILESSLNQRAWVFQERLLAHRALHFTYDQLLWRCPTKFASQPYIHGVPLKAESDVGLKFFNLRQFQSAVDLKPPGDGCATTEVCKVCELWAELVTTYTSGHLTYPDDRPAALAGLASTVGRLIQDQYIVGFWRHHLQRQLYWLAAIDTRRRPLIQRDSRSRRELPSFSWLSLDVQIACGQALWPSSPIEHLCKIIDLELQEPSTTAHGFDQSGWIKFSGILIPISIHPSMFRTIQVWDVSLQGHSRVSDGLLGALVHPDWSRHDLPSSSEGRQHFLLPLNRIRNMARINFLILELIDDERAEYRRIGAGDFVVNPLADGERNRKQEVFDDIIKGFENGDLATFFLL